jgi:hypothetical protein
MHKCLPFACGVSPVDHQISQLLLFVDSPMWMECGVTPRFEQDHCLTYLLHRKLLVAIMFVQYNIK